MEREVMKRSIMKKGVKTSKKERTVMRQAALPLLLLALLLGGCSSQEDEPAVEPTIQPQTTQEPTAEPEAAQEPTARPTAQPTAQPTPEPELGDLSQERISAAMEKARKYIEDLTVNSTVNVPAQVVADDMKFFTWDNEKRRPGSKAYLYEWSYYNGVVMEGLWRIYEADPENNAQYQAYVKEYLDAMAETDESGHNVLSSTRAGYVDYHGADCYKTAALMLYASEGNDVYMEICRDLYQDLTDAAHANTNGHIVAAEYTEEALGHNYWHSWSGDKPPQYKVWLDGIYMLQPFIANYAAKTGDTAQLALVQERLGWVAETLLAPNGLYYHAANSAESVCDFHWTRAIGWYGMAMVDAMEAMPDEYMEERKEALKTFVDGLLQYQDKSGLWANLADREVTATNRLEVSGTSMIAYTILKGVRNGWLDESYKDAAVRAFVGMAEFKLDEKGLHDIYFKASANGGNNYEKASDYLTDEGKGSGPFILAYSEMLRLE